MQSEIWLREDILNALRAVAEAGLVSSTILSTDPASDYARGYQDGYQRGFATALRAVGAAFGLQTEPRLAVHVISDGGDLCLSPLGQ